MSKENTWVKFATLTALVLLVTKFIVWIFTWSIAVLSSAIDSMLDMFVSIFNYIALKNSAKPADEKFNYWRWKIEALASFLEWIIISISWIYIFYESVLKIINNEWVKEIWPAIYVMIFSVIVTSILVIYLKNIYKQTWNMVIEADSMHYKTDLYTNVWILFSLWLIFFFPNLYFIDWTVWIIISFYIIISAFWILKKWFLMILDVSLSEKNVSEIKKVIESFPEISSYHFLKTRKSAKINFVQAHLVFKDINIKLIEAHYISEKIECKIVSINSEKDWIIDFHLDPYDDKKFDEWNRICKID